MPILFSAVASAGNIKVNFASCDGNFLEIADQVLSKIPAGNNKMTYSHGIYLLHYIVEDSHFYFCITDRLCQRSRAFLYLNEIQRRYKASKEEFTAVLAAEMYRYSENYNTISIRKGELDELNSIGVGCSESILGEKILYINNPDNISYSTISYVGKTPEKVSTYVMNNSSVEMDKTPTLEVDNTPKEIEQMDNLTTFMISETAEKMGKLSISLSTSRMYVITIGVLMVIIGLVVYAFGPISCAVITSVGVFTFLRSVVSNNNKSE